jgi:hypothetical protein
MCKGLTNIECARMAADAIDAKAAKALICPTLEIIVCDIFCS